MLSAVILSFDVPNIIMLSLLSIAECCRYAECHYAECRGAL